MNCFLENLTLGNPEVSQGKRVGGRSGKVQGPPGKMFYMSMIFMLTFYPAPSRRTRNKRVTIFGSPPDPSESLGLGQPSAPSSLKGRRSSKRKCRGC